MEVGKEGSIDSNGKVPRFVAGIAEIVDEHINNPSSGYAHGRVVYPKLIDR